MYTRKLRSTGETLTVARPEEIGADPSEGKWVTFCEDHKTLVYSATEKLAYYTSGFDFCDDCRKEAGRIGMHENEATPEALAAPAAKTFPSGTFAIELGEGKYAQIHKASCRDLVDGEVIESEDPMHAHEEFWPENGPFASEAEMLKDMAPCAKAIYKKG